MKMWILFRSEQVLSLSLCAFCVLVLPFAAEAQNQSQPTTDPAEGNTNKYMLVVFNIFVIYIF